MTVFELIISVIIAIFIGFYVSYYLICLVYIRSRRAASDVHFKENDLPRVSIIVPVYNEVRAIKRKIENLQQTKYPFDKLEVVFVDGGSDDGTVVELDILSKGVSYSQKIVKQGARKGFNSAVIEGFYQTTGDIIFITGAETEYDPNAVRLIVNHFADLKVGAVNGTMRISNLGEGVSTKIEASYRSFYDFIREAESKMDSPFDIKGEIAAARRSVCQHLVDEKEMLKKGCIDACFSFQAKVDSLRTIYEPSAVYYEPAPKSLYESFKQQIRRAATLVQNMLCFRNLMLKSRYGLFGLLIMPAHFMMLIILPYLFLVSTIGIILLIIVNPSNLIAISFLISGLAGITFSQRVRAFFKVQIALVVATFKMLTGVETQKFERLRSAR